MRPVCCSCHVEMRCQRNGVMVRYTSGVYRAGDRYECPGCGARFVTGLSVEHFALDGEPVVELLEPCND